MTYFPTSMFAASGFGYAVLYSIYLIDITLLVNWKIDQVDDSTKSSWNVPCYSLLLLHVQTIESIPVRLLLLISIETKVIVYVIVRDESLEIQHLMLQNQRGKKGCAPFCPMSWYKLFQKISKRYSLCNEM